MSFHEYKYSEYKGKSQNRRSELNKKYIDLYIKFIKDHKSLTLDENKAFEQSIVEITKHLSGAILSIIHRGSEKPKEKKLITLYNKYSYMYEDVLVFSGKMSEDLYDLSLESIYEAVGYSGRENRAFKKTSDSSNIVTYMYSIYFYKVLNFIEKNVNALVEDKNDLIEDLSESKSDSIYEIEELLDEKKVKTLFGDKIYDELKEILISETEFIPKNLVEIIKYIKT